MEQDQDRKIRQTFLKKDRDFNDKIRSEMEEEENMLKSYFKQYKKPVQEDPSIIERQTTQQRQLMLKSALSPFRVFGLFYDQYWNKQFATPEQRYVIKLCKQHTKKQMAKGILFSIALTSLVSFRMRMSVGAQIHALGFMVGISSGLLYGMITSSQYSLQRFESLGENYALGRSTLAQIQKFRMDKQM